MPALPLDEGVKYVVAAYAGFAVVVLVYLAVLFKRLARRKRELDELSGEGTR